MSGAIDDATADVADESLPVSCKWRGGQRPVSNKVAESLTFSANTGQRPAPGMLLGSILKGSSIAAREADSAASLWPQRDEYT